MKYEVMFTCHICGLQGVRVSVDARGPKEDVKSFMDRVAIACGKRHRHLAPTCAAKMFDLALPVHKDRDEPIGASMVEIKEMPEALRSKGAN